MPTPYGVLTKRTLVRWGIVGLILLAAVAFLVGHFAAREHTGYFDWELASIFGTALGTTALALATGALSYTTSADVRAAWEGVRQQWRPVVLVSPRPTARFGGSIMLALKNVGRGPALAVQAWLDPDATRPDVTFGESLGSPGRARDERFVIATDDELLLNWDDLNTDLDAVSGQVVYSDIRTGVTQRLSSCVSEVTVSCVSCGNALIQTSSRTVP